MTMASDDFPSRRVAANGIGLNVVERGSGPLMLFVHGFPEFWYIWRPYLTHFEDRFRAVAYDMRGYNLSDKPEGVEAYKTRAMVEDQRALIKALGYDTCTLVAHDWGGSVAWLFAILYPEMVDRLVIVNAPHPAIFVRLLASDPAQQKASGYINKYRDDDAVDYLTRNVFYELRRSITDPGLAAGYFDDADAAAYLAAWSQPGAVEGMVNYYKAMAMAPPHSKTGAPAAVPPIDEARLTVRPQTQIIWGMRDRFLLPQCLEGIERFVPDVRIHRIADAGHWVLHERPEEVMAVMDRFLSER